MGLSGSGSVCGVRGRDEKEDGGWGMRDGDDFGCV